MEAAKEIDVYSQHLGVTGEIQEEAAEQQITETEQFVLQEAVVGIISTAERIETHESVSKQESGTHQEIHYQTSKETFVTEKQSMSEAREEIQESVLKVSHSEKFHNKVTTVTVKTGEAQQEIIEDKLIHLVEAQPEVKSVTQEEFQGEIMEIAAEQEQSKLAHQQISGSKTVSEMSQIILSSECCAA